MRSAVQGRTDAHRMADGAPLDRDHNARDSQPPPVPVDLSAAQAEIDTHRQGGGADLDGDQVTDDAHGDGVPASLDRDQHGDANQVVVVPVDLGVGHAHRASQEGAADAMLLLAADTLDDLERVRIATQNRVRALRDVKGAADSAEEQKLDGLVAALAELEHQATLELRRRMREHPYGPWVRQTLGIGEKQGARLLAAIGDPTWNDAEDRPRRGPAELWAYCGYAPGQKRQKGTKSNWNASAKMRAFLCAESCMKTPTSPYREVYLARRAHTATTQPEWTLGHSHNDALRIVAKEILKDLWRWGRAEGNSKPKTATPAHLHEVFA